MAGRARERLRKVERRLPVRGEVRRGVGIAGGVRYGCGVMGCQGSGICAKPRHLTSKELCTWDNGGGVGLVVCRVVRAAQDGEGDDAFRLHLGLVDLDVVVDGRLGVHGLLDMGRG